MNQNLYIAYQKPEQVLVSKLTLANNFFSRLKGLIGSNPLSKNEGLLISPCQQIHTHFMRYSIDIVFLDKQFKILHIVREMKPWRFSKFIKPAYYVLELPAQTTQQLKIGEYLSIHEDL